MANTADKKNIFVNVLLTDILSKEEINYLKKYPQFQTDSDNPDIGNYIQLL